MSREHKRSGVFLISDVDDAIEYIRVKAEQFACPSDFWSVLSSEVAYEKKRAEESESTIAAARGVE